MFDARKQYSRRGEGRMQGSWASVERERGRRWKKHVEADGRARDEGGSVGRKGRHGWCPGGSAEDWSLGGPREAPGRLGRGKLLGDERLQG